MKNKETIATDISVEIFNRMINSIEMRIQSQSFKTELSYNSVQVNKVLGDSFSEIVNLLQSVVDKFYLGKYEVTGFQQFSLEDFDFCLNHNLSLITNCKKLIKFAS